MKANYIKSDFYFLFFFFFFCVRGHENIINFRKDDVSGIKKVLPLP